MSGAEPVKVLVLGQTPPPFHGQALSIERLVRAGFSGIEIYHVRMAFSSSIDSVGRFGWGKVLHLLTVMSRAIRLRFRHDLRVLYFAPAGPNWVPVLRDIVLLIVLRGLYPRAIFHFHAAGLSTLLASAPKVVRYVAMKAYEHPAAAIQCSWMGPPDAAYIKAERVAVVPIGLEDDALPWLGQNPDRPNGGVRLLYVGAMLESKGVLVLLDAVRQLREQHPQLTLWCMGQFGSRSFEERANDYCRSHGLDDVVTFLGPKVAPEKWEYFRRADVFCFPSFYESESFPSVIIEAMMFRLPVVATLWRAIPDIVEEGSTGLLVPTHDAVSLSRAIRVLLADDDLRRRMGANGRQRYLERFTLATYLAGIEEVFRAVGEHARGRKRHEA